MKQETLSRWTSEDAAELYGIRNWGDGYFDISEDGNVIVKPQGKTSSTSIDLLEVIKNLQKKNLNMPILLRFADILSSQIQKLNESFAAAIKEVNYQGSYRAVYPIKVNQKQLVIKDIMDFGGKYHHGLEAGSKAELIAAISNMQDSDAFLICNGYKDEEFLDLALLSQKIGIHTIIVIEMPGELPLVLERAKLLNVRPRLGIRAKLSTKAGGHWDGSGGDRSKFGMNVSQIIDAVDTLKKANMLDCLQLLHYHLGSQVPDIRRVRMALQEACCLYVDLVKEGAKMGIINVGGGLAVDYDGSHTNFASSRNYSMKEYARDVVEIIMNMMDEFKVPHPTIVSESGRATVAHHSILLFNILDVRQFEAHKIPEELPDNENEMILNIMDVYISLNSRNLQELYHDAVYYRDQIRSMFLHGNVTLRERALVENIFWQIITRISKMLKDMKYVPDEMEGLEAAIADVYYSNFSLFQSIPDSWAIDQLFPIMPIHRLNETPKRKGVLADISCDSDGKIDKFIDLRDVKKTLPLHKLLDNEEYYLAAFLVGAYQETLGDMHNLLGNVNVVHIRVNQDGEAEYVREIPGDSVEKVLSYVEYNPETIINNISKRAKDAQEEDVITPDEKNDIIKTFSDGMKGYTYFER